jgi:hypothetical protein
MATPRALSLALAALVGSAGCGSHGGTAAPNAGPGADAGGGTVDTGSGACVEDDGVAHAWPPEVTTTPGALAFDLLATSGVRFWLDVSPGQQQAMNVQLRPDADPRGPTDVYALPDDGAATVPGVPDGTLTFADRVLVDVPCRGAADFGRLEVRLAGTSTRRPLVPDGLPTLRFDADEFQPGHRVGGVEHFRLNNGVIGSLLREHLAAEVHRALGYPAPRTRFAALGTTVHGPDVRIPMVLTETYERGFCTANAAALGGGCAALWKFDGDLGCDDPTVPCAQVTAGNCETGACDAAALQAFGDAIRAAPEGDGVVAALAPHLDWPAFHRFRCLALAVATVDDTLHNAGNNTVLAQRVDDGRFVFLPYSMDISALGVPIEGQSTESALRGNAVIVRKCDADPACRAATRATCQVVAAELRASQPAMLADAALAALRAYDLVRPGDEERGAALRAWYATRADTLEALLADESF